MPIIQPCQPQSSKHTRSCFFCHTFDCVSYSVLMISGNEYIRIHLPYSLVFHCRSTLPVNMLSYLEHYNCDYFLLENVKGLLDHPLMSRTAKDGRSLEGGIKSGIVKLIMRALIALGYVKYAPSCE